MRGKFITFEGSEGSGKSTQAKLLHSYLKRKGYPAVFLREPGGTKISEKIRRILLDAKNDSMNPACEMLLYMASRAQVVDEVIKPALDKGRIVICDRFLDSTIVYQGYALGLDIKLIESIGAFVTKGISPDMTFFLDVDVKKGLKRSRKVKGFSDRIELRSYEFHNKVRKGYIALSKRFPKRITTVSADKNNKDETQHIIREKVLDAVKGYNRPGLRCRNS